MKWSVFSAEIKRNEIVAPPTMTISDDDDLVRTHFISEEVVALSL